ncbi:MAG: ATP-binding protein [Verrucomicrobiales bacterium]|nr:ATP-binding protein [Verrucomicrobiales bacterium]
MDHSENHTADSKARLAAAIRKLIALPKSGSPSIEASLDSFADQLAESLSLDFLTIILHESNTRAEITAERSRNGIEIDPELYLSSGVSDHGPISAVTSKGKPVYLAIQKAGERGTVVAGSSRKGFPTEDDQLILDVGITVLKNLIHIDREAEEARLNINGPRYRLIGEAIKDPLWDWNLVTNEVVWNEGLTTQFGFAKEEIGDDAKWWGNHIHPDDRERVLHSIHSAIDGGDKVWEDEYSFKKSDGSYARVYDRGRILHDERRKPIRMIGSMLDLSEKLETETLLKETRSRLNSTLAAADIATWKFDPINGQIKPDPNLARMFGVRDEESNLDAYLDAIHPDDRDRVIGAFHRSVDKGTPYDIEYRILRNDEDVRWVAARGRVEQNEAGNTVNLPGVVIDITSERIMQQELEELATRLKFVLSSAQTGDWNLNLATGKAERSLLHDQCFGYDEPLEDWSYDIFLNHVHPDDREAVDEKFQTAISRGEDCNFECRVIWPNGSIQWIEGCGSNYRSKGEETCMLGTVRLITARKDQEKKLLDLAAQLSEADYRKDEFIATLAHELRNPLAPIRTGLEVMKMARADSDIVQKTRDIMEQQTRQLIALVDDLLDLSRITSGKLSLSRDEVDLNEVLECALGSSHAIIHERRHHLEINLPADPIVLDADPNRLAQIVSNLLNNAAKYTPVEGHIIFSVEREGNDVIISVEDNGLGIPPDMLDTIFETFAQIDHSDRDRTGLGLGLSLVKTLVEMHGGTISAQSEGIGKGSVFTIRLPIVIHKSTDDTDDDSTNTSSSTHASRLKVLVVDDNLAAASTLSLVVEMLGNTVHTAHNGKAAVEEAATFKPDVILMDLGMPVMDGYEAARQIRKLPEGKSIRLVALTGWGQKKVRQKTGEAGFDYHLVKPAEPDSIREILASVTDRDTNATHRPGGKADSTESSKSSARALLINDVENHFGLIPNFFRLAPESPEITGNLWGFAKAGYINNPLPSLFKERLFVYMSRFCKVRYCIARHVGFLTGLGNPSGDSNSSIESIDQAVELIAHPLARGEEMQQHIERLTASTSTLDEIPEPYSRMEEAFFACATHVFLQTGQAPDCLAALRSALPPPSLENLLAFLTFVRTAHFWSEVHPELTIEDDLKELFSINVELAECVLQQPESEYGETSAEFLDELAALRRERSLWKEIKMINESLKENDRQKDEFIAVLAHELRNPLAPIRTGLEVIKMAEGDQAVIEKIRPIMEKEIFQLTRLIDDLLDISRISRGKFELQKSEVAVSEIISSATEATLPLIEEANHKLTVNLPDRPITLRADSQRISQVVAILLNNAVTYTPEGGRITLSAECQSDNLVISVEDNGIGITSDKQPGIFAMFSQIAHPPDKTQQGLGVGLSLAKSIVEMHGGTISVASEGTDRGSVFRVYLPLPE